jgi:hypothetical protein
VLAKQPVKFFNCRRWVLLSTIQANRDLDVWLRFRADTTAYLWCGIDATEGVLKKYGWSEEMDDKLLYDSMYYER